MATDKKYSFVSRRGFLGLGLLLPYLSIARSPLIKETSKPTDKQDESDDQFTTMLTSDGGVVKVRKEVLKNATVVKQNMSNQSLLDWLKLKYKG